jgi:hypothetical protein
MVYRKQQNPKRNNPSHSQPPPTPIPIQIPTTKQSPNPNFSLENPSHLPRPTRSNSWTDSNNRYFVLTERIRGKTLEEVWLSLSADLKNKKKNQYQNRR